MIGIYKITNKVNNKIYIGQSRDIQKRWKEHKLSCFNENVSDYESKKNKAFRKYGLDNFTFEIIEEIEIEKLNEREIYWIEKLNSVSDGYNTSNGGHAPNLKGEYHSQAKNNQKEIDRLIILLRDTNTSYDNLMQEFNLSRAQISNINQGKNWTDKEQQYPLRKNTLARIGEQNGTSCFSDAEILEMRELYKDKTIKQLTEIYKDKASESAIKKILTGETYKHLPVYKKSLKIWIEACID